MKSEFTPKEGGLLIVGFIVVSVTFAAFVAMVRGYDVSIALPTLSIAGIILLLLCLTAITYAFARIGLHDRSQALGLPAGSIQSVIALALIVLFAILSVFVFTSIGSSSVLKMKNLSAAERDLYVAQLGSSFAGWLEESPGKFTVYVRDPGMEARNDVGKQLIVLIGTLMTSAVSFYFGTRAALAGADAATSAITGTGPAPGPTITGIEPGAVSIAAPVPIVISGTKLEGATGVTFALGADSLAVIAVRQTAAGLECQLGPITTPLGKYDVSVVANGTVIASRAAGLEVVP